MKSDFFTIFVNIELNLDLLCTQGCNQPLVVSSFKRIRKPALHCVSQIVTETNSLMNIEDQKNRKNVFIITYYNDTHISAQIFHL